MLITKELAGLLVEIDEERVVEAAETFTGDNNFKKLLFLGAIYRRAGLEPIYLATPDLDKITVSCRETYNRRLH